MENTKVYFNLFCSQGKLVFHYNNILIHQPFIIMCYRLKLGPFLLSSEIDQKLKKAFCVKRSDFFFEYYHGWENFLVRLMSFVVLEIMRINKALHFFSKEVMSTFLSLETYESHGTTHWSTDRFYFSRHQLYFFSSSCPCCPPYVLGI